MHINRCDFVADLVGLLVVGLLLSLAIRLCMNVEVCLVSPGQGRVDIDMVCHLMSFTIQLDSNIQIKNNLNIQKIFKFMYMFIFTTFLDANMKV